MKRNFAIFSLFFIVSFLSAQKITITNGTKEKSVSNNDYLEVVLGIDVPGCDNDCSRIFLEGMLHRIKKDSIAMKLKNYRSSVLLENTWIQSEINSNDISNVFEFPITDLGSIDIYKSKKSMKRKNNFMGLSGVFVITGLTTGLSSLLISNKEDRNKILIAAAAQVGIGISFGIASHSKTYLFKNSNPNGNVWRIKQ